MPRLSPRASAVFFVAAAAAALPSCRWTAGHSGPAIVQPGAPGTTGRTISREAAADLGQVRFTEADVRFMQGMIGHHRQAVEMTSLVPARTENADVRRLAQRIEVSQADEIGMMESWLRDRGQPLPDPHAHHAPAGRMPGMLAPAEMAALAAASDAGFDRLFLQFMIRHHEGALTMVEELFASPGAGQEPEIFAFASDVEADQQIEIDRMLGMLRSKERSK